MTISWPTPTDADSAGVRVRGCLRNCEIAVKVGQKVKPIDACLGISGPLAAGRVNWANYRRTFSIQLPVSVFSWLRLLIANIPDISPFL